MAEKRYYWLKLKEEFFIEPDIKLLKSMSNGKDYVILYLQLQLLSLRSEGILRYKDIIPYTAEMLSTLTDTNVDVVKSAIGIFEKLKLVEIWDDGTIYLAEMQKLIGTESESAERVRRHREQKVLALQCNDEVTNCNTEIEIEIEKELDKDIDIIIDDDAKEYLLTLQKIKNYPYDQNKDMDYYRQLAARYQSVDLVEMVKDWAAYKLDKPLKPKDKPRSQINTQCNLCIKWQKCIKKNKPKPDSKTPNEIPEWFKEANY